MTFLQIFYKQGMTFSRLTRSIKVNLGRLRMLETNIETTTQQYQDQHLLFEYAAPTAYIDLREVTLTRKEHELLALLVRNDGEIVPRDILLDRVWGYGKEIRTRTLDVHIRRLRKKLFPYGEVYIETIFGVGYRFQRYRESRPFMSFQPALAAGF